MSIWSQFKLLRTNGPAASGLETPDGDPSVFISNRNFDLYMLSNIYFYT